MGRAMIAFAKPALPPATRERTRNIALWMIQVVLAAQFALAGTSRLAGRYQELVDSLNRVGADLWMRQVADTLDLSGALGLVVPCMFAVAAIVLVAVVVFASAAHLVGLIAWAHWPPTRHGATR
jgi:putative oxidoreductase